MISPFLTGIACEETKNVFIPLDPGTINYKTMKRSFVLALALFFSINLMAQNSGFGLGAIVGSSVDFSVKWWMGEKTALHGAIGYDYTNPIDNNISSPGGVHLNVDYLIHKWWIDIAQDQMAVYFGTGVGIGLYRFYEWDPIHYYWSVDYGTAFSLTVRAPVGAAYHFHGFPLEAFIELVPAFQPFGPGTFGNHWFWWGSYVGAHWYF